MERVVQLMDEVDALLVFAAEAWPTAARRLALGVTAIAIVVAIVIAL